MKTFQYNIRARRIGALGTWQSFDGEVEAESLNLARLKLYETFEHIVSGRMWVARDTSQPSERLP